MKNKLWGVPGKQNIYNRPKPLGEKVPLNTNTTDSWDYKKSKYRRIELVPRNNDVSFAQQQGGVPETTSVAPTSISPTPTPSITPTPTLTPIPVLWNTNATNWENETGIWNTI